jgi:hypothetical protein
MVAARVYSVTQEGGAFTMTVADLSDTGLAEQAVIDNAIKTLAQEGEIKLNIPARVSRVFGRQLSILRADGSRSSVALFYHEGRLYQIEGKSLAAAVADLHRQRLERADGRAPAKKSWRSRRSWSAARSRGAAAALSAIRVMPPRVAVSRRPCARRSIKAAGRIMCH